MPTPPVTTRKTWLLPFIITAAGLVLLLSGLSYLNRPAPKSPPGQASPEAKAYLSNLDLKDVTMKASENFMKQQVVEIEGSIGNKGSRPLQSIDVYCLFYSVDGHELHRERVPVVSPKAAPLKSGESRPFRLPFDNLPDGWNQALPKMVIAQIDFAR